MLYDGLRRFRREMLRNVLCVCVCLCEEGWKKSNGQRAKRPLEGIEAEPHLHHMRVMMCQEDGEGKDSESKLEIWSMEGGACALLRRPNSV